MIQRKQTLFLFQSVFLSLALLFVPSVRVLIGGAELPVSLSAIENSEAGSTAGHFAAIAFNFLNLLLVSLTVFLYNKRSLQVKLIYAAMAIWAVLAGMVLFCPFAQGGTVTSQTVHVISPVICVVGIVALFFAQRFIKKDIELLKSADRIR